MHTPGRFDGTEIQPMSTHRIEDPVLFKPSKELGFSVSYLVNPYFSPALFQPKHY